MEETINLAEFVRILWKRKWFWILIPILAAIVAWAASMTMTPVYEASAIIVMGTFKDNVYSSLQASKELILSPDTLAPVAEELQLPSSAALKSRLRVDLMYDNTMRVDNGIIKITAADADAAMAQRMANAVAEAYMARSNEAYAAKRRDAELLLETLRQRQEQAEKNLEQIQTALVTLENEPHLSQVEKDVARQRLLDDLYRQEETLDKLTSQAKDVTMRMLELNPARMVAEAQLPEGPVAPRTKLNVAAAVVLGCLTGVVLALLTEYFSRHPIRG